MTTTVQLTTNAATYLTGALNATLTLNDYVGDYADDFDMDVLNEAYRTVVAGLLAEYRPTWSLCGDQIYTPIEDTRGFTPEERADFIDELNAVDIGALIEANQP